MLNLELKNFFEQCLEILTENEISLNKDNRFPVSDADTGTNMLKTLSVICNGAEFSLPDTKIIPNIIKLLNSYTFGNSGFILSRIIIGFLQNFGSTVDFSPIKFKKCFQLASANAYGGVFKPVEGTMLTMVRVASEVSDNLDHTDYINTVYSACSQALEHSKRFIYNHCGEIIPDSGARGLYYIIRHLLGKFAKLKEPVVVPFTVDSTPEFDFDLDNFTYCLEFVVRNRLANDKDIFDYKQNLARLGGSICFANGEYFIKVHIHTDNPGEVLSISSVMGMLDNLKMDNMYFQRIQNLLTKSVIIIADEIIDVDSDDICFATRDTVEKCKDLLTNKIIIVADSNGEIVVSDKNCKVIICHNALTAYLISLRFRTIRTLDENYEKMLTQSDECNVLDIQKLSVDKTVSVVSSLVITQKPYCVVALLPIMDTELEKRLKGMGTEDTEIVVYRKSLVRTREIVYLK